MKKERIRILVADEDHAALAALVAGLSRAGFDVVVASDADEATRLAADVQPALALLSIRLAGRVGPGFANPRGTARRVPFLVVATAADRESEGKVAALGALGVLRKPFDMARVVPAVRAALAKATSPSHLAEDTASLADALEHGRGRETLIAIGILMERNGLGCDDALELLHERAREAGLALDEVAVALIEAAERGARPAATPPAAPGV